MSIKYPVRVSLTDETLIVDQDNASIATTFFGKEDYDAEYERRALDAAVIAECLNKRKALNELEESCLVAGEAYQVIGDLALAANLYDHPEVQRALDWFSGFEPGVTYKDDASILPWPKEELKADDGWFPIESAPRDGTTILVARDMGTWGWILGYSRWDGAKGIYGWISNGFSKITGTLGLGNPTHWMPLPDAPITRTASSGAKPGEVGE